MTNVSSELTAKLDPLRPFVERIATVRYANKKIVFKYSKSVVCQSL